MVQCSGDIHKPSRLSRYRNDIVALTLLEKPMPRGGPNVRLALNVARLARYPKVRSALEDDGWVMDLIGWIGRSNELVDIAHAAAIELHVVSF